MGTHTPRSFVSILYVKQHWRKFVPTIYHWISCVHIYVYPDVQLCSNNQNHCNFWNSISISLVVTFFIFILCILKWYWRVQKVDEIMFINNKAIIADSAGHGNCVFVTVIQHLRSENLILSWPKLINESRAMVRFLWLEHLESSSSIRFIFIAHLYGYMLEQLTPY